jgi:hypothetical protein
MTASYTASLFEILRTACTGFGTGRSRLKAANVVLLRRQFIMQHCFSRRSANYSRTGQILACHSLLQPQHCADICPCLLPLCPVCRCLPPAS